MFKVNTIKTPERRHLRRSVVFIENFEHISDIFLVFPLLTLSMYLFAGPLFPRFNKCFGDVFYDGAFLRK